MELGRKAGNIAMRYMEILRFEELENGSSPWKSRSGSGCTDTDGSSLCRPVSDGELDVYDRRAEEGGGPPKRKSWYLVEEIPEEVLDSQQRSAAEQEMDTLWKCFHQAVAIPERANEKLQNSLIPLKFREFMNEFQKI